MYIISVVVGQHKYYNYFKSISPNVPCDKVSVLVEGCSLSISTFIESSKIGKLLK